MKVGKMPIYKLGCAALAALLCIACLVGCGGTGEDQSREPTANTTAASEYAETLVLASNGKANASVIYSVMDTSLAIDSANKVSSC